MWESRGIPRAGVGPVRREAGGAQGGEAVSRQELPPKEDDRSQPGAVVSC